MTLQSTYIRHATDDDYYMRAVSAWNTLNQDGKYFAECCAMVTGSRTVALAADCKCSVDTIEQYRNAYRLYYRMSVELESEQVRKLWRSATMELWKKAAQLWSRLDIPLGRMLDYIQTADEHGMSRESFAAHVDEKENHLPGWVRTVRRIAKALQRDDFMPEVSRDLQAEYEQARDKLVDVLIRMAESVEA